MIGKPRPILSEMSSNLSSPNLNSFAQCWRVSTAKAMEFRMMRTHEQLDRCNSIQHLQYMQISMNALERFLRQRTNESTINVAVRVDLLILDCARLFL